MQKTKTKTQRELVEWRRAQVIELISKGKNLTHTAEILKVDVSTVCRDYQYIRENSGTVLKKYLAETLPLEVSKCLSRLNAISNEAWKMAEQAADNQKTKLAALYLAQEAALHIVNVVTNNKPLIEEAFRFAEEGKDDLEYSYNPNEQESKSLNGKKGEEKEDYDNNELPDKSTVSQEDFAAAEETVF